MILVIYCIALYTAFRGYSNEKLKDLNMFRYPKAKKYTGKVFLQYSVLQYLVYNAVIMSVLMFIVFNYYYRQLTRLKE